MPCFHPLRAFFPLSFDSEGKRRLIFSKRIIDKFKRLSIFFKWKNTPDSDLSLYNDIHALYDSPYNFPIFYGKSGEEFGYLIDVPCGKCVGCKLDYSRMWATRSVHEAYMSNYFNDCAFVTLTFNDDMLYQRENPHSLNKVAFRCFLKRLRKAISQDYGKTIRYMVCGEYGSKKLRPHYHMIIYGFNFPDKYIFNTRVVHGTRVFYYRSPFLEKLWKPPRCDKSYGFSIIGAVNYETSAYVARYVTKKLHKKDPIYLNKEPEFLLASRNKGLGYSYLLKYYKNIFDCGYIVLPSGFKAPIPRYYYNQLLDIDQKKYYDYTITKLDNLRNNILQDDIEKSVVRLNCKEELSIQRLNRLYRTYEFDTSEIARYGYVNKF